MLYFSEYAAAFAPCGTIRQQGCGLSRLRLSRLFEVVTERALEILYPTREYYKTAADAPGR